MSIYPLIQNSLLNHQIITTKNQYTNNIQNMASNKIIMNLNMQKLIQYILKELKQINIYDSSSSEYDLRQAAHPIVCILTILFKICAVCFYLVPLFMNKDKIAVYIAIVLLVSFDFWITKNISGRLLVGLRWQNLFDSDGTELWSFESHDCAESSNRVDKAFFWTSLMGSLAFWMIMVIGDILTLQLFWITLSALCLVLSSINAYGFYKCRGEHQKKIQDFHKELTKKGLNVVGMVMLNQTRFYK